MISKKLLSFGRSSWDLISYKKYLRIRIPKLQMLLTTIPSVLLYPDLKCALHSAFPIGRCGTPNCTSSHNSFSSGPDSSSEELLLPAMKEAMTSVVRLLLFLSSQYSSRFMSLVHWWWHLFLQVMSTHKLIIIIKFNIVIISRWITYDCIAV